jgi:hypothetical protein
MNDARENDPESHLKLELYRTAVQTRNMEIELFWKRSNYFLVLNTAIAVGFFAELENGYYAAVLAFLCAIVSGLWFLVNLGSKYWQSRWEHRSAVTERALRMTLICFLRLRKRSKMTLLNICNLHLMAVFDHLSIDLCWKRNRPLVSS